MQTLEETKFLQSSPALVRIIHDFEANSNCSGRKPFSAARTGAANSRGADRSLKGCAGNDSDDMIIVAAGGNGLRWWLQSIPPGLTIAFLDF